MKHVSGFQLARGLLLLVGILTSFSLFFVDWLGSGDWGTSRRLELAICLTFLSGALLLYSRRVQAFLLRHMEERMLPASEVGPLVTARVFLFMIGLFLIGLALAGEYLGLRSSKEWTGTRWSELYAGLVLLFSCWILGSVTFREWCRRIFGTRRFAASQIFMLMFALLFMVVPGFIHTFLALSADGLGLDSTPGWGSTRKLQLVVGICLLLAAWLMNYKPLQRWVQRRTAVRMLETWQIAALLAARVVMIVAGVLVMAVVSSADWLGIDPTPGWGWPRTFHFIIGFVLFFVGILLGNIRLAWGKAKATTDAARKLSLVVA
jgi:hypothetical protein